MANSISIPLPRHSVVYQRFMLPSKDGGCPLVLTQYWAWSPVDVRYPIWEVTLGSVTIIRTLSHLCLISELGHYYGFE